MPQTRARAGLALGLLFAINLLNFYDRHILARMWQVPDYWTAVVCVAFSIIFWFLLCVAAAQFGLSKESLGPKKILLVFLVGCPIGAVILMSLLGWLGVALAELANYGAILILKVVGVCLLTAVAGYLVWKGLTFTGGGIAAWWQWLVGHFR